MPDFCDICGANLALVGRQHRCVPRAVPSVANSETVANNNTASVANRPPRWAAWRSRHPDLYRQRQRDLMRARRARGRSPASA
jgi:hypothetical protein